MLEWARSFNGPSNRYDVANAVIVDDSGYVYVTGYTQGTMTNNYDYCTIKYKPNGDSVWVRILTTSLGSGFDIGRDLQVDNLGNVYVTGSSGTVKYDKLGNIVWQDLTPNSFEGVKVTLDNSENIYVAGTTINKFTLKKYNQSGILIWSKIYDDGGGGTTKDMAIDKFGNIILTGEMAYNNGNSYDFLTVKYNSLGDSLWSRRYNGAGNPPYDWGNAIDVDDSGYVYVTGLSNTINSTDYLTFKYSPIGQEIWMKRYSGGIAYDIEVDNSGSAFVTGVTALSNYTTLKYDLNGNLIWSRTTPGNLFATNVFLAIDKSSNVFIAHESPRNSWVDLAIIKYNNEGEQQWLVRYPGSGNVSAGVYNMKIDNNDNIYAVGVGPGIGGVDYLTVKFSKIIGIVVTSETVPYEFKLYQNYPNPFNPETKLRFQLPYLLKVKLSVFDILGKEIIILVNGELKPGTYEASFDGGNLPSGIYFAILLTEDNIQTIKLTLVK